MICETTSDAVSSIESPHSTKRSANESIASTIFPGSSENHSATESMNSPMLSRTPENHSDIDEPSSLILSGISENHSAIEEPSSFNLSGIPLKNSTISSQCSLITTTAVATAATIPATAAATKAGAPRITAPTAANAIPTTIRASFTALKPFTNISTKLVTARTVPPIIEPIPAIDAPNSVMNTTTLETAPAIEEKTVAICGNSSFRTSIKVPAPPLHKLNPSTIFPITPQVSEAMPLKVPSTEKSSLTDCVTLFATFNATIADAIVPIASPMLSKVAGS